MISIQAKRDLRSQAKCAAKLLPLFLGPNASADLDNLPNRASASFPPELLLPDRSAVREWPGLVLRRQKLRECPNQPEEEPLAKDPGEEKRCVDRDKCLADSGGRSDPDNFWGLVAGGLYSGARGVLRRPVDAYRRDHRPVQDRGGDSLHGFLVQEGRDRGERGGHRHAYLLRQVKSSEFAGGQEGEHPDSAGQGGLPAHDRHLHTGLRHLHRVPGEGQRVPGELVQQRHTDGGGPAHRHAGCHHHHSGGGGQGTQ